MKTPNAITHNIELANKCRTYNFEKLFEKLGYSYFTKGCYNLNIIGIRANKNKEVTNKFDDILVVKYIAKANKETLIYPITTEPGLTCMRKPTNAKGTAILAPGQYIGAYKVGKHKGKYDALCQHKRVWVYRDNNKDNLYDYDPTSREFGIFGINIHRSHNVWTSVNIDGYSAGCQVFADPNDYSNFMNVVKKSLKIFGNSFTYTLINEDDMIDNI